MSLDTLDIDLQEAERVAAGLAHALREAQARCNLGDLPAVLAAQEEWELYCRPSCGFLESGECGTGGVGVCSCPCVHDETVAV